MLFLAMVLACLAPAAQGPPLEELNEALDALRYGRPGQPEFEAALPRLPELLASDEHVRGAAYLVAHHKRAECAVAVVEVLRRGNDHHVVPVPVLFDALIRTGYAAPPDVLFDHALHAGCASILYRALLCETDPEALAANLARFVELGWDEHPSYWAAAIELTAARDPRFVAHLFDWATWDLWLAIRDPGSAAELPERENHPVCTQMVPMWPPMVSHSVLLPPVDGALDSIEFERKVHLDEGPIPQSLTTPERIAWRARILRELAPSAPALDLRAATVYVERIDAPSIRRAIREHVEKARATLAVAAKKLAEAKLLADPDPAIAAMRFRVEIRDLRRDRGEKLPALGEVEGAKIELR